MRAATVVQQLCKSCRTCFMFYCMIYFTCDRSLTTRLQYKTLTAVSSPAYWDGRSFWKHHAEWRPRREVPASSWWPRRPRRVPRSRGESASRPRSTSGTLRRGSASPADDTALQRSRDLLVNKMPPYLSGNISNGPASLSSPLKIQGGPKK